MKRSDLKKQIEEVITEILSEDLYAEKPGADPANKLPNVTTADKATANDPKFKTKYEKVSEAETEDEFDAPGKEPSKAELKKSGEKEKKEGSRLYQYQEELKRLEKELKDNKETSKKIITKKENDRTQSDKNHLEKMSKITKRIKVLRDKMEVKL